MHQVVRLEACQIMCFITAYFRCMCMHAMTKNHVMDMSQLFVVSLSIIKIAASEALSNEVSEHRSTPFVGFCAS